MPVAKLVEFLDQNNVRYVTLNHSRAYTAQEVAAAAHVPGKELAKPVMVKLDGKMAMAVVPASYQVDLAALARVAGAERAELATEEEFKDLFPGSEVGAMPPFGNLWGLPVHMSRALAGDEDIAFQAGTHTQLLRMRYQDYERLVKPNVGDFGRKEA
jgi:Ala-tRNA(Pro) deacylase